VAKKFAVLLYDPDVFDKRTQHALSTTSVVNAAYCRAVKTNPKDKIHYFALDSSSPRWCVSTHVYRPKRARKYMEKHPAAVARGILHEDEAIVGSITVSHIQAHRFKGPEDIEAFLNKTIFLKKDADKYVAFQEAINTESSSTSLSSRTFKAKTKIETVAQKAKPSDPYVVVFDSKVYHRRLKSAEYHRESIVSAVYCSSMHYSRANKAFRSMKGKLGWRVGTHCLPKKDAYQYLRENPEATCKGIFQIDEVIDVFLTQKHIKSRDFKNAKDIERFLVKNFPAGRGAQEPSIFQQALEEKLDVKSKESSAPSIKKQRPASKPKKKKSNTFNSIALGAVNVYVSGPITKEYAENKRYIIRAAAEGRNAEAAYIADQFLEHVDRINHTDDSVRENAQAVNLLALLVNKDIVGPELINLFRYCGGNIGVNSEINNPEIFITMAGVAIALKYNLISEEKLDQYVRATKSERTTFENWGKGNIHNSGNMKQKIVSSHQILQDVQARIPGFGKQLKPAI
jgi:hypothetical protein